MTDERKRKKVAAYLRKTFIEARFDTVNEDGSVWCSDSNASLNPDEMAVEILKILQPRR